MAPAAILTEDALPLLESAGGSGHGQV